MKAVQVHDMIHGLVPQRGTGVAILEAKLQQELVVTLPKVLHQVYIDLKKAHDKLNRDRALQALEGCTTSLRT